MASGSRNQQTARAGEYYVAAELSRRGVYAVTFAGNMPKIDILASNTDQSRTVKIQIKTRKSGTWQCSIDDGKPIKKKEEEDRFWIFVDLTKENEPPEFYIVPDDWIRNNIYETHKAYLDKRFGTRPITLKSKHHAIEAKRLIEWKNKWELLRIF
jgi:Holliday junction resolvase-like predicted endonuclease